MVLFPPTDVNALSLAPGASSSSIDIFTSLLSHGMKSTHPVEAELQPGDVLYIPPLVSKFLTFSMRVCAL